MFRNRHGLQLALFLIFLFTATFSIVSAADEANGTNGFGSLTGTVMDSKTKRPLAYASVELLERHRGTVSDADGRFVFDKIAAGAVNLKFSQLGYTILVVEALVSENETVSLTIELSAAPLTFPGRTVTAKMDRERGISSQREIELRGSRLWQNFGMTVAKTLENEPGIGRRSMGPVPARPVLRGLDGNRLLVLQDGQQAGDLSATSPDHAVAIDPIGSSGISIIRGPEGFLYGSNVLGGVVNVQKDAIPGTLPERPFGTITFQGESVNTGGVAGLQLNMPIGPFATRFLTSGRTSDDVSTPIGKLTNTSIDGSEGSAGATYFYANGFAGVAGSWYNSHYGIPGGFLGGHPNGVTIDLKRQHVEATLHHDLGGSLFRGFKLRYNFNRYFHEETESNGACGVSFGVLTYGSQFQLTLGSDDDRTHARVGVSGEYRDYAQGCLSFVPPTIERAAAAFLFGATSLNRMTVEGALRYDYHEIEPQFYDGMKDSNKAGEIIPRAFKGFSGGISARYNASNTWDVIGSIMLTRSLPNTEVIYADGPHLAAYSYEVGNSAIAAEKALGFELALESGNSNSGQFSVSAFYYRFQDYIYPRNTGEFEFGPGEEGLLVRYQFDGQDARLFGGELLWETAFFGSIRFGTTASYVVGDLLDDGIPIPFMPPFNGKVWFKVKTGESSNLSISARGALEQTRTSEFEEPTDGYIVFDILEQRQWYAFGMAHNLILGVENLFDVQYREHLSRVKSVMPQPGLNAKILYRISF